MAENLAATEDETPSRKRGDWRSFPKVPNLFQYVNTGSYYARVLMAGKTIRRRLKTQVGATSSLKSGCATVSAGLSRETRRAWDGFRKSTRGGPRLSRKP
jgi:hypothetical protein